MKCTNQSEMNPAEKQNAKVTKLLSQYREHFGTGDPGVFAAPGRTEIGGNHTDHQNGMVLAAAIDRETLAAAAVREDGQVAIFSEGYGEITFPVSGLDVHPEETGTTAALIRGTARSLRDRGIPVGGFSAYLTSEVPAGSGLSSSASFEVAIGAVINGLFGGGRLPYSELAKAAQEAENRFFGKPSGLMDQMACAAGGLIQIDFKNPNQPLVREIPAEWNKAGWNLCIVNTYGSHADLTADYAEIPMDMKAVASCYGKTVLREVPEELFYSDLPALRKRLGDRPVLRALHFFEEERRVLLEADALIREDFEEFLDLVRESGLSSFQFLQNVTVRRDPQNQSLAVALAESSRVLGKKGACRVHGGGFAGTIQAFVPDERLDLYQKEMNRIFGEDACQILQVLPCGERRIL